MPEGSSNSSTTCESKSNRLKSLWLRVKLSVLLLPVILPGCQTTTPSLETSNKVDFCAAARPIYYSRHDTAPTREQVQEHNAVGVALNCGWIKNAK